MSFDPNEISKFIKERQELVKKARTLIETNHSKLSTLLKSEGLSVEDLGRFHEGLDDRQKKMMDEVKTYLESEIQRVAVEKYSAEAAISPLIKKTLANHSEHQKNLPADVALKGKGGVVEKPVKKKRANKRWG